MQCAQHPWDAAIGVCALCLRERLTLLLLHGLPPSHDTQSPSNQHHANPPPFPDNNSLKGKFPFSRFKQGQGQGSPPSRHAALHADEKKENGARKPRARSAWISALLPRRHRKKLYMPAPAAAHSSKNLSFLSARSSLDEESTNDADFAGRDEVFHEQLKKSGPVTFEFEDYYSDSDLTKRGGGGGGGKGGGRIFSRLKKRVKNPMIVNGADRDSRAAGSSTTARVSIFSESEDEESRQSSPHLNPPRHGNCNSFFSGVFPSPSPKAKGRMGAGLAKHNHADCAGSFSPYTDRKLQSSRPFSMARREDTGFAFCLSPRKLFSHDISRSPRHGGKLSHFFFSPLRRST